MKPYPYYLETERLVLRSFEIADKDRVYQIASTREIYDSIQGGCYPYEEYMAECWVASQQYQYFQEKRVPFAITLKSSGELIGTIVLIDEKTHGRAEIGYWLDVDSWGCGYTTEAVKAVLDYGFKELNYHRIHASHMVTNPASGRVLMKAGMECEGIHKEHVLKDGVYRDIVFYGMLNPYESAGVS
jgi:RimJ/RimL family protein N-acetyltransferase